MPVYSEENIAELKSRVKILYAANQTEEALKVMVKIPEEERDYEMWFLAGNIAQDNEDSKSAIYFLQKSIRLNPAFDKAYYNLGNIYLSEKRYNAAIEEYKTAIKYKKDFAYSHYNLGCAYLGVKAYRDAKSEFEKAIKLKAEPDFYYNLAYVSKLLNKPKDQQAALDKYNELKEETVK